MTVLQTPKDLGAQAARGDLLRIKENPGQYAQGSSLEGHLAYHLQLREASHMTERDRDFTSGYIEVLQEEIKRQRELRQAAGNVVHKLLVTLSQKTRRVVFSSPQAWEIAEFAEVLRQRGIHFDYRFLREMNSIIVSFDQIDTDEATSTADWLANLTA